MSNTAASVGLEQTRRPEDDEVSVNEHRHGTKRGHTHDYVGVQLDLANDSAQEKYAEWKVEQCAGDDTRRVPSMDDGADEVKQAVGKHEKADPCSQNES